MSLPEIASLCIFCRLKSSVYTCPRCNLKYCSSHCYKNDNHRKCSEEFFREWIETSLQCSNSNNEDKQKMLEILKKHSQVNNGLDGQGEIPIEERFSNIDLESAEEEIIWQNLSENEREEFQILLKDQQKLSSILPLKKPWWLQENVKLVTEITENGTYTHDEFLQRPPLPREIKLLTELSSVRPSNCIKYNLVNILYAYSFVFKFYNGSWHEFLDEVVNKLFILSPVLSKSQNYYSIEEAVMDSIRLITSTNSDIPLDFVKSITYDIACILKGPTNMKSDTFVLCALNDIKLIFSTFKYQWKKKNAIQDVEKKIVNLAEKKLQYMMSWSIEAAANFSEMVTSLSLVILPDALSDVKVE